jgi:hypothetical protein
VLIVWKASDGAGLRNNPKNIPAVRILRVVSKGVLGKGRAVYIQRMIDGKRAIDHATNREGKPVSTDKKTRSVRYGWNNSRGVPKRCVIDLKFDPIFEPTFILHED